MRFLVGGRPFEVGPGDFVYLPRDIEHSWKIKSPTAKTLVFIAPAGLEAAFKEMSEPAETPNLPPEQEGPPDIERMLAVFGALGVRFAPPPSER